MLTVKVEAEELKAKLRSLRNDEIPTALRNAVNDTALDVIKREEEEVKKVFDRPTPIVQKAFWLEKKATKQLPEAQVWIKDVYGDGTALINTLSPHIPGQSSKRKPKGIEAQLRHKGLLGANQFLIPSRTMKLDKYGNITGGQAQKMLADLNAYTYAGAPNSTGAAKAKYVWGTMKGITGIWDRAKFMRQKGKISGALMMLVVNKAPTYRKRFDFFGVGKAHAASVMPRHLDLAIQFALQRRT